MAWGRKIRPAPAGRDSTLYPVPGYANMAMFTLLAPADLATITPFAGLPPDTVAWLLAHGEGRAYAAGEIIFEPGTPAEFLAARTISKPCWWTWTAP